MLNNIRVDMRRAAAVQKLDLEENESHSGKSYENSPRPSNTASPNKSRESNSKADQKNIAKQILGRKRRTRRQPDLDAYKTKSLNKIEELKQRIAKETDPDSIKKLKNQISSYESRLLKRAQLEEQKVQLNSKDSKMDRFVDILREELTGRDFKRIMKRIDEEMRDD